MIVFIDIEHETSRARSHGEKLLAARTWITYRLEDLAGQPCHLTRYDRVTPELVDMLAGTAQGVSAIFLSGNSAPLDVYDSADLDRLYALLRDTPVPMFGFCGGMQFLALAFGARLEKLDQEKSDGPSGRMPEYGYAPFDITAPHPVVADLGPAPVVRHAHGLHVPEVPAGFTVHGSTPMTPVQVMVNEERRIVGTQFHPEYWTEEFPAGQTMIANFLVWAASTESR